jgi:hypothetical protein
MTDKPQSTPSTVAPSLREIHAALEPWALMALESRDSWKKQDGSHWELGTPDDAEAFMPSISQGQINKLEALYERIDAALNAVVEKSVAPAKGEHDDAGTVTGTSALSHERERVAGSCTKCGGPVYFGDNVGNYDHECTPSSIGANWIDLGNRDYSGWTEGLHGNDVYRKAADGTWFMLRLPPFPSASSATLPQLTPEHARIFLEETDLTWHHSVPQEAVDALKALAAMERKSQ